MGTRHFHSWGKLAFNVFLFGSENEGTIVSSLHYSLTLSLITAVHKYKLQRFTFLSFCLLILCSCWFNGFACRVSDLKWNLILINVWSVSLHQSFKEKKKAEALSIYRECISFVFYILVEIKLLWHLKLFWSAIWQMKNLNNNL